jgi:hypothetical protein
MILVASYIQRLVKEIEILKVVLYLWVSRKRTRIGKANSQSVKSQQEKE